MAEVDKKEISALFSSGVGEGLKLHDVRSGEPVPVFEFNFVLVIWKQSVCVALLNRIVSSSILLHFGSRFSYFDSSLFSCRMEALYAKLYDKYTKLKKKKFSEFDEVNREQEEKFLNFVSASEELMQHLRSENQNLLEIVDNLRNEMTSIRSSRDNKCLEYQKLLMEEEQKNKALSEVVVKLNELVQEGHPRNYEDQSGRKQERKTPETAQVTTRSMRKRSRPSEDMVETDMISPHSSKHHKATETLLVSQPQCCKTSYNGSSSSASCTFQALGEHLLGMKLSTINEGEHICIVASHPATGLSFSLTSVKNSTGEEPELLYKVVSLGTFQRVAPEWMRDVIKFSTSMCPVFFERVSRVIKLQC